MSSLGGLRASDRNTSRASEKVLGDNQQLAAVIVEGNFPRFIWGAFLAFFSAPLYVFSVYALYNLSLKAYALVVFIWLISSYVYSPVAHTSFLYVGGKDIRS